MSALDIRRAGPVRRGTADLVVGEIADLTGRSPDEVKLGIGVAAVLTCAVVVLRTINFFADLDSASAPRRSARHHRITTS